MPDLQVFLRDAGGGTRTPKGFRPPAPKFSGICVPDLNGAQQRTFFRHFADKREVLFAGAGADALRELLVSTVAKAPGSLAPIDVAAMGLEAAGALIQEGGELARQR